ncbi:rhodanese-like domain-containing protein [Gorillibacterium massiliense]|uniref:rhodanese-like domain-containing protein n=1 Tax=Gorillibacterium massiliense TaxID=1280390 RepID=UPI0004B38D5F|nr:rhodanese-like domain-containing protein [Gorillibacterium massiliense]
MKVWLFLIGLIVGWKVRFVFPVRGIKFVDLSFLTDASDPVNLKMLDIRDSADYLEQHLPETINISLGRLPFVWDKELSPDNHVLIMGEKRRHCKKAAHILKRAGFVHLYILKDKALIAKLTKFIHNIPIKV